MNNIFNNEKGIANISSIIRKVVRCGDFLKVAWHLWYGHQRGCDPFGVDHGHDDDWEHITINFIRDNQTWQQDSVTFNQHSGFYTRYNTQQASQLELSIGYSNIDERRN